MPLDDVHIISYIVHLRNAVRKNRNQDVAILLIPRDISSKVISEISYKKCNVEYSIAQAHVIHGLGVN